MRRGDYVGSPACMKCHRDVAERWRESPMRNMTRSMSEASVEAPFDGRTWHFMDDRALLETRADRRYVRVESREKGTSWWRVTKVIGGRLREDFAGVRVAGPHDTSTRGEEYVLPMSWLRFEQRYRYKGYSVLSPERPGLRRGSKWRTTCIVCHNTVSSLTASLDELHGPGAPVYQGSTSLILPPSRRPVATISDESALEDALARELSPLGVVLTPGEPAELLRQAMRATRQRFGEAQLVELGIGCEACHGGGRAHAAAPTRVGMSFAFRSEFARVTKAGGGVLDPPQQQSLACARCHTVLFSRYPYTWEGGRRHGEPGGSPVNSGEARDFLLGGCATRMTCSDCHDPHARDAAAVSTRAYSEAGNATCTRCHDRFASAAAARTHSRHAAGSAGNACMACHMPRKNLAVDYSLTAYHRIGSPTDPERLYADRPIECALCHADLSTEQLVRTLERWTGRQFDRPRLRALYGRLDQSPIRATLRRGKPHEQAVAASVAATARLPDALPLLLAQLENPYPLVRLFARDAIERSVGERMEVDDHRPAAELLQAATAWARERGHLGPTSAVKRAHFE